MCRIPKSPKYLYQCRKLQRNALLLFACLKNISQQKTLNKSCLKIPTWGNWDKLVGSKYQTYNTLSLRLSCKPDLVSIDETALNTDIRLYYFPSWRQKPLSSGTSKTDCVSKFVLFQGSTYDKIKCVFVK